MPLYHSLADEIVKFCQLVPYLSFDGNGRILFMSLTMFQGQIIIKTLQQLVVSSCIVQLFILHADLSRMICESLFVNFPALLWNRVVISTCAFSDV